jgi:hypothetical protein
MKEVSMIVDSTSRKWRRKLKKVRKTRQRRYDKELANGLSKTKR